ncbi:MAG: PAS domain S-box protein [Phycisphaerae bacterium]|nr:PAS domain S-box protein [Phycisphaerae bacterium]MDD5381184.1 PAS domain S-box protein [Phycisphaerae bacterium]
MVMREITDKQVEEMLRESEERLREAQKMAYLGYWVWDIKTGNVQWSEEVFRIFHLDPKEFTPQIDSIMKLSPWPEDHNRDKELIEKATKSREIGTYEQRFLYPDKSIGYYYSTFQGRYDAEGNLTVIVGTVQDITERKRAEDLLKDSEVRFRELFEHMSSAVAVYEPENDGDDFIFKDCNQALLNIEKVNKEEIIGRRVTEVFPSVKEFGIFEVFKRVYITGNAEHFPVGLYKDERISGWKENYIYKLPCGEIVAVYDDVTERKQAEEAMKTSEVRYRRLFETAQDGILILNAETGTIVDVNPFLVEMLGFSHEQFVGKAIWEIGLFKDIASNKDKFAELQQKKYVRYEDLPLETAGGQQIEVEFVSNIYTVDHHKVIQCNIRDITERKQLEKELKDNVEMKSKFISMASHELRSPLGVIKEGINLVLEGLAGGVNDEQRDLLATAKRNTDRLGRLINNVLDFQKIDSGKMGFDTRENDINEAVLEVNKTMSLAAKEKGLDLVVVADNGIPRTEFDKDKIIQVLTNLVSNAIKYTEKGSITISTKQEDNAVHVIVQDTGIGIKAEDIQKLFQAFEQLDSTRDKKGGGTGLGLAISKEIILAHKGRIWAESEPGKGSAFHFSIPMKIEEKKKIGEILVEEGKISEGDLKKVLEKQEKQE